jgi:hypothetical protein
VTAFFASLLTVAGVLAASSAVGWIAAGAVVPAGRSFRGERLGWCVALGAGILAAMVPLSFLVGARPGWMAFAILSVSCLAVSWKFRLPHPEWKSSSGPETRLAGAALGLLILLGVSIYTVEALTEPMWSNDFVAIWGLKGKVVFLSGGMPEWLRTSPGFSHPEYPLGLPFLYAGVAFLTRRWDDHAMALLFPLLQVATLAALLGWLRRKGASLGAALLAGAILANFKPLYSAFLTGLAELPLAFGSLLFGCALADALDPQEPGALRRVALAAAILAATKNEGLFLAAAGCGLGLALGGSRRWRIAAAALPTALLVHVLHLLWRGRLPLRDFDFSLFSASRLGEALTTAAGVLGAAGWTGLALVAVLVACGRRRADADAILLLAAAAAAVYLLLPAFAVRGPVWMVQTTLTRIGAALAPLAAAGIALRFAPREL